MGKRTLEQFREDLVSALGQAGLSNQKLDRWINEAYDEVLGAIEFEKAMGTTTFYTSADLYDYPCPRDLDEPNVLVDTTNKTRLAFVNLQNFAQLDETVTGKPERWTLRADRILLWPVPDDAYQIRLTYTKLPPHLEDSTDVTILPRRWDNAIDLMAKHYAFAAMGDLEKAQYYYSRAIGYIRSRRSDKDFREATPALGIQVITSEEDLLDLET